MATSVRVRAADGRARPWQAACCVRVRACCVRVRACCVLVRACCVLVQAWNLVRAQVCGRGAGKLA